MSTKPQMLQKEVSKTKKAISSGKRHQLNFTFTLIGFAALLTLSILNEYLFIGWLSISMAIILSLMAIHIIGDQQTRKSKL